MNRSFEMTVNFGYIATNVTAKSKLTSVIDSLMHEYLAYAQQYNEPSYGYSGREVRCNLFSCEGYYNESLVNIAEANDYSLNIITDGDDDTALATHFNPIVLNARKKNFNYENAVSEYIINSSDAVFLIYDEAQSVYNGILWSAVNLCKQRGIPYYLVNANGDSVKSVSFSFDYYYLPYDTKNVKAYTEEVYKNPKSSDEWPPKKVFLSDLWTVLYKRYLKKFKIKEDREVQSVEADKPLCAVPNDDTPQARNHKRLVEYFEFYDSKAIKASAMYRASMYFRSVIPFVASMFIAVGFYAETILKFTLGAPKIFGMSLWTVLASIGFLVHALINIYSVYASKNPSIKSYRDEFVQSRFIAEYLRILIYCEPYGVHPQNLLLKDNAIDKSITARLHAIIREQEPTGCVQTPEKMANLLSDLKRLIEGQIDYHERSIKRYDKISRYLEKCSGAMYVACAVVVLARGFFQIIIPYVSDALSLGSSVNGVTVEGFLKSAANMVAFLVPAWASYFSGKLNLNSYEWLRKNSENQKREFLMLKEKLEGLEELNTYYYQELESIVNDVAETAKADYVSWYFRIDAQKFTRI